MWRGLKQEKLAYANQRDLHFFFLSTRIDLLIFMMTATRTIAILLVMTIVAVNAKQLPHTLSKRDFVEIGGRYLGM